MDNYEKIVRTSVNTLEEYLKLHDSPTKTGFFAGKDAGPIAATLEKKGWIKRFGKEDVKQIWQAGIDSLNTADLSLMRRIVDAKNDRAVPFSNRIYGLSDPALKILEELITKSVMEGQGLSEVDKVGASELISQGFAYFDDNGSLRLVDNILLDEFEGINFGHTVTDLINTRNEREAAKVIKKERSE